tara:strand:+ start:558 stop:812 length:255 start_codon:yes stop_codon:yes gene_type:complete
MELKIRQKDTGQIYSSDMSDENKHTILSFNFCTSYTQVEVQDEIDGKFSAHDVILPPYGVKAGGLGYAIDHIATQGDPEGEWIK